MIERTLGKNGLKVSAIGLGCMGMSEFYDPSQMDDDESIRVIHRYLDAGGNFLDTADMYGSGRTRSWSARRWGRPAPRRRPRHQVRQRPRPQGRVPRRAGRRGKYVRECCEASLSGSRWTSSISTTSTASTRRCRSRRRSAPWPSS
jgi:aryl-alcohol dehydrogenase-like predicted oxidoreductase